jgi:hypothetical protein
MRTTAEKYFHGEEGLNCAQAVLKTFQETHGVSDEMISEHKKSGGGRAEGNLCGALYSSTLLEPELKEELHSEFASRVGFTTCRDIRKEKVHSCRSCTGLAAELLESMRSK